MKPLLALIAASLVWTFGERPLAQSVGFGAPQQERKIVDRFDTDGDKRLNTAERRAARLAIGSASSRPGRMGPVPLTPAPGPELGPAQVKTYRSEPIYDLAALRTFFLRFEGADWEQELMDVNAQQFNGDFVREWFGTRRGVRWKVPGNPRGRGGLEYLGEDAAAYKRLHEIKTDDDAEAWTALINLCRVLNTTPPGTLEDALAPVLDVDATLRFLALEVAMVNSDGYWTRASDYNLYRDTKGRFHVIPHDVNEGLGPADGRGGVGPGGGVELDPLVGLRDSFTPLRSKLLAVPALRARYLGYIRDIADRWLDWTKLEPMAARYQALIAADVKADTRKLDSVESFHGGIAGLETFVAQRRAFLLNDAPADAGAQAPTRPSMRQRGTTLGAVP